MAKAVANGGGINILADLTRSMNKLIAEEAAGGLWNLSVGEENKVSLVLKFFKQISNVYTIILICLLLWFWVQNAIAEAGGVKALVDLIFKWPYGIDGILVIT